MIKNNWKKLIVTSVVILLPILFGVIVWDRLPERIATHWGADGNPDGWSGRAFAVFGMPLFLLAIHWLCAFFTARDPKNKDRNRKAFGLVLWICPLLSLLANTIVYATALGKEWSVEVIMPRFMGLLFVDIGNYLPKCQQNHTIGIRIKWTLESEDNWNATHRLSGRVWMVGGALIAASAFLPIAVALWVMIPLSLAMVIIPVAYSYTYHKRHGK